MTNQKAPAAEGGINPKLAALAAKLDEAKAHARGVEARKGESGIVILAGGLAVPLRTTDLTNPLQHRNQQGIQ